MKELYSELVIQNSTTIINSDFITGNLEGQIIQEYIQIIITVIIIYDEIIL